MTRARLRPDRVTRSLRRRLAEAAPVPGLEPLVRSALGHALRADHPDAPRGGERPRGTPGDPGLCGPGSASWQVLADLAGLAAGLRALVLQTLHPLAMAGVADHSSYASDPFGRLHRTSAWVTTSVFGSLDEVLEMARLVRGMHERVVGTAPDGRSYAAGDAVLLTWVSISFTDSLLACDTAFASHPVDGVAADRFVLEQSRLAALLDPRLDLERFRSDPTARDALRRWEVDLPLLDEGLLPHDRDSLRATLARYDDDLVRGEQARDALRFLAEPGLPPLARPAYDVLRVGAVATLPRHVRDVLGWHWLRGPLASVARRNTGALLTAARLGTGTSPARDAALARIAAV